jgi:DNA replication and repair protein RecF
VHLERLDLVDFRNFHYAHLELGAGVRVFVGANAQGKTNLLEAVHYLATGTSHRVSSDAPLVRSGAEVAVVGAVARNDPRPDGRVADVTGRRLSVELEVRPGGRKRAKVNGQPQPRARDALGLVRSVLFAPEDLQLVRGDPSERRRFLDELLGQRRPAYLSAYQDYEQVLRQRNALLRSGRGHGGRWLDHRSLRTWTDALVEAGATVLATRLAAVHALAGPAAEAYHDLGEDGASERRGGLVLAYQLSTGRAVRGSSGSPQAGPADLAQELREGIEVVAAAERERGVTLRGPHRDDVFLGVGDLPAKGYASHGEAWSLALALRLASRELLAEVGEEPVILLDDVFAELDVRRRERLAARCADYEQVLVSAAVDEDVPLAGPRHLVRRGTVTTLPLGRDELAEAASDGSAAEEAHVG